MPAKFDACVRSGGRVRTKGLSGNRYIKICYSAGKSTAGHVHKKKKGCLISRSRSGVSCRPMPRLPPPPAAACAISAALRA